MWTYRQKTGEMLDASGKVIATGYAGKDAGKNNPDLQDQVNVGPLPTGLYRLNPPMNTTLHGPYVLWLSPDNFNAMHGRSGFGVHSDGVHDPGEASEGCIIVDIPTRQTMWNSGDHNLSVISGV